MKKEGQDSSKKVWFARLEEGFIVVLLLIQIAMIAYFNLRDIRNSLDNDCAITIYHFREVIRNGTLNLQNWNHTTSLELDATFLFALPLYYIVHDIFKAVGIANLIYMVLYIIVIGGILKCVHVRRKYIWLTLCLVLTPYAFGMLDYFNMLFYGVTFYGLKTLVPLLCIWNLLLLKEQSTTRREKWCKATVLCVYLFFLFMTSFSTGIYVILCGIFPICCCALLDIWKSGKWNGRYNWRQAGVLLGSFLVFLVGNILHQKYYGLTSRFNMRLTKIENYAINFRACVRGIFDLFGATISDDIEVLSINGIWYCLKMAFVVLLVFVWLYNLRLLFQKHDEGRIKEFLAVLPLFNFLVLLMADSRYGTNTNIEYRYYLIGAVPMLLLLGIQIDEWCRSINEFQQNTVSIVLLLALAVLMGGNNKYVIDHWDRTSYAVDLCDYFNTLDIESVFFVDDPDTSHICKGIDGNHRYGTFMSDTQTLEAGFCSYQDSAHGSYYGNKNAMAVFIHSVPGDYMPAEIAQHYQKVATVRWFDIYVSDQVWFP